MPSSANYDPATRMLPGEPECENTPYSQGMKPAGTYTPVPLPESVAPLQSDSDGVYIPPLNYAPVTPMIPLPVLQDAYFPHTPARMAFLEQEDMLATPFTLSKQKKSSRKNPFLYLSVLFFLLGMLCGGTIIYAAFIQSRNTQVQKNQTHSVTAASGAKSPPATVPPLPPASNLLFGTNLGLYNAQDIFLTNPAFRQELQSAHVQTIRLPVRTGVPVSVVVQAVQDIKAMNMTPLVILYGATHTDALTVDTQVVTQVSAVMGTGKVFYEFGNEEDLAGVSVGTYTAAWNAVIPKIKPLASNGDFIGPVNYQYNGTYLTAFLKTANPQPNEISWHEYTCPTTAPAATCLANIDHWTTHITAANAAMQAAIGKTLPIMITEWNYCPNISAGDGKVNNPAFLQQWTTKALQVLSSNHVYASMHYPVTSALALGSGTALTSQGQAFQQEYSQLPAQ